MRQDEFDTYAQETKVREALNQKVQDAEDVMKRKVTEWMYKEDKTMDRVDGTTEKWGRGNPSSVEQSYKGHEGDPGPVGLGEPEVSFRERLEKLKDECKPGPKKCRTCKWFDGTRVDISIGFCHRHAPTTHGFPEAFSTDWCGDYENKG